MKRSLLSCHVESVNSKQWGGKYVKHLGSQKECDNKLDSPTTTLSSYNDICLFTFIKNVTVDILLLHFLRNVTTKNININIVTF